jgi:hypothetical protein
LGLAARGFLLLLPALLFNTQAVAAAVARPFTQVLMWLPPAVQVEGMAVLFRHPAQQYDLKMDSLILAGAAVEAAPMGLSLMHKPVQQAVPVS